MKVILLLCLLEVSMGFSVYPGYVYGGYPAYGLGSPYLPVNTGYLNTRYLPLYQNQPVYNQYQGNLFGSFPSVSSYPAVYNQPSLSASSYQPSTQQQFIRTTIDELPSPPQSSGASTRLTKEPSIPAGIVQATQPRFVPVTRQVQQSAFKNSAESPLLAAWRGLRTPFRQGSGVIVA